VTSFASPPFTVSLIVRVWLAGSTLTTSPNILWLELFCTAFVGCRREGRDSKNEGHGENPERTVCASGTPSCPVVEQPGCQDSPAGRLNRLNVQCRMGSGMQDAERILLQGVAA